MNVLVIEELIKFPTTNNDQRKTRNPEFQVSKLARSFVRGGGQTPAFKIQKFEEESSSQPTPTI